MKYFAACLLLLLTGVIHSEEQPVTVPLVTIQTNLGPIEIELNPIKAPESVENFLSYVKEGFYEGTIFHRVIANFVIQGGGYDIDYKKKTTHSPIPNEAANGLKNLRGTVTMARSAAPHSATSQFFINVKDNQFLDYKSSSIAGWGYCVFGKVIEGMEVVDKISKLPTDGDGPFRRDVPQTAVVIEAMTVEYAPASDWNNTTATTSTTSSSAKTNAKNKTPESTQPSAAEMQQDLLSDSEEEEDTSETESTAASETSETSNTTTPATKETEDSPKITDKPSHDHNGSSPAAGSHSASTKKLVGAKPTEQTTEDQDEVDKQSNQSDESADTKSGDSTNDGGEEEETAKTTDEVESGKTDTDYAADTTEGSQANAEVDNEANNEADSEVDNEADKVDSTNGKTAAASKIASATAKSSAHPNSDQSGHFPVTQSEEEVASTAAATGKKPAVPSSTPVTRNLSKFTSAPDSPTPPDKPEPAAN